MTKPLPRWYLCGGRPNVVCLVGSTKFRDQIRGHAQRLTLRGDVVLTHGFYHHVDRVPITQQQSEMLDSLMDSKIDLADSVLVVNVNGYIGESTARAITYARKKGREVQYVEPPSKTGRRYAPKV